MELEPAGSDEEEKVEIRDDIVLNMPLAESGSDMLSPPDSPRTDDTIVKQSRLQWLWGKLPTINIFSKRGKVEGEAIETNDEAAGDDEEE